ncbi:predicted protein [Naegleria gruberi]|uniref:Predicted protein n=1 Tax=Naegleria gruberi TaxID=5762 RepID=D2UYW2_NAEGR|nr:uncharacterized protein NAEGRDRAFT_61724 [Naegleria gruberi]EFC50040.1 predicted protein [Naegleria gruberi]|eukprot:XP_002682784.1 predicted protein [Naegleria gruberi strain NEG-M]
MSSNIITETYPLVLTASVLNLIYYIFTALSVGSARVKYGVKAPAVTGNLEFERVYRIQMNGLEYLTVFISGLWLTALASGNDFVCGIIGLVYLVGRILYGLGYPNNRSAGFGLSFLPMVALLIWSAYLGATGVLRKYIF